MKLLAAFAFGVFALAGCASTQGNSEGGWLLIVPPISAAGTAETYQPLSKWEHYGSYYSQVDCQSSLQNQQFNVQTVLGPITVAQGPDEAGAVKMMNGRCMRKDDARLNG